MKLKVMLQAFRICNHILCKHHVAGDRIENNSSNLVFLFTSIDIAPLFTSISCFQGQHFIFGTLEFDYIEKPWIQYCVDRKNSFFCLGSFSNSYSPPF